MGLSTVARQRPCYVGVLSPSRVSHAHHGPCERRIFHDISLLSIFAKGRKEMRDHGGNESLPSAGSSCLPAWGKKVAIDAARPRGHRLAGDHPGAGIPAQAKLIHCRRSIGTHATIENRGGVIALLLDMQDAMLRRERLFTRLAA